MSAVLAAIARLIGIGGVLFVGLLLYEEGIPGAARIRIPDAVPLVGGFGLVDVPVIGDLTAGRVKTYAAEQVKIATAAAKAVCDGKLEKMVSGYELAAAKAEIAELERQRNAAAQVLEDYRKRARADQQSLQVAHEKLERAIAEDVGDDGGRWTDVDQRWMQDHRGRKASPGR